VSTISIIRKADIALIIVLAATAILGMVAIAGLRTSGGFVEVVQHGEVVQVLELGVNGVHVFENGAFLNVVQIIDGSAKMIDANCPDEHCMHQAPIIYSGQTIVCLPNRMVIQVHAADASEHDVILR